MQIRLLLPCLLLAAFATPADAARRVTDPDAPRSLPVDGQVDVRWSDPAQFSDIRYSANRFEAQRGDWVERLAEHLRKRATRTLPPGERLEVEITDVRRAGMYEPWRGPDLQNVRVVRDQYPPRMELHFQRLDADGRVIEEGDRKLVDFAFLSRGGTVSQGDALRYEKAMIDRWLRDEFETPNG
jgi:hypothetical protein